MAERLTEGVVKGQFTRFDSDARVLIVIDEGGQKKFSIGLVDVDCGLRAGEAVSCLVAPLKENEHLVPPNALVDKKVVGNYILDINSSTCKACPLGGKHIRGETFRCPSYNPKTPLPQSMDSFTFSDWINWIRGLLGFSK